MNVALDTNVLAAAFGTRGLCADVVRVVLAGHDLVLSEFVLTELRSSLATKYRMPDKAIAKTESLLRANAVVAADTVTVDMAMDPDDALVFGAAIAGRADVLVTGDEQLQQLGLRALLAVLSPRQFWLMLRGPAPPL